MRSVRWRTDKRPGPEEIAVMNRDRIEGKWRQFSGSLRERWGLLSADRRCVNDGRREQLAGRAQELYGVNKEKAEVALKEFLRRNRRWNISGR